MIYEYEWGYYALSKNKLNEFIKVFDSFNLVDVELEQLRRLVNSGFSFRLVISKKWIKYNHPYVYDFQISEEGAHFIHGTGIVISNTTTVTNLGAALVKLGKEVIILDANVTTPNLSLHLGIPFYPVTLHDVLKKQAPLDMAIYQHPSGLKIIPGSLSVDHITTTDLTKIEPTLLNLLGQADIILIDAAAGLGGEARAAINVADEILIVTNPDIPAVTDALKTIKLAQNAGTKVLGVVLNRVKGYRHEMDIEEVETMLDVPVIAVVPEDISIPRSIATKSPAVISKPKSRAARAYKQLAASLTGEEWISEKQEKWYKRLFSWMG